MHFLLTACRSLHTSRGGCISSCTTGPDELTFNRFALMLHATDRRRFGFDRSEHPERVRTRIVHDRETGRECGASEPRGRCPRLLNFGGGFNIDQHQQLTHQVAGSPVPRRHRQQRNLLHALRRAAEQAVDQLNQGRFVERRICACGVG